jgi:hypothetical protein
VPAPACGAAASRRGHSQPARVRRAQFLYCSTAEGCGGIASSAPDGMAGAWCHAMWMSHQLLRWGPGMPNGAGPQPTRHRPAGLVKPARPACTMALGGQDATPRHARGVASCPATARRGTAHCSAPSAVSSAPSAVAGGAAPPCPECQAALAQEQEKQQCLCVCRCVCVCLCVYVYVCVCVCMCVYVYVTCDLRSMGDVMHWRLLKARETSRMDVPQRNNSTYTAA